MRKDLKGFTIVELMLASIVFSFVMLAALTGFMQIGRIFYQGVSMTQTQGAAQKIVDDITGNISTSSNVSALNSDNGYKYYCVGNARYTYTYKTGSGGVQAPIQVNLSDTRDYASGNNGGNFGLLRDILPGNSPCATPCYNAAGNCSSPAYVPFRSPTEMLGNDMRLSNFQIAPSAIGNGLYNVAVTLAYGNDNVLANGSSANPQCLGGTRNTQFCAVAALNTSIYEGLHP